MAVISETELAKRLVLSGQRLREVQERARALNLIRQGPEPEPTTVAGPLAGPSSVFVGQAPRAREPAR